MQMAVAVGVLVYAAPDLEPLALAGMLLFTAVLIAIGCWIVVRCWRLGVLVVSDAILIDGFGRRSPVRVERGDIAGLHFGEPDLKPKRSSLHLVTQDGAEIALAVQAPKVSDDGVLDSGDREQAQQLAHALGVELTE